MPVPGPSAPVKPAPVRMTPPERVRPAERDNLLVAVPHAVEHVAKVVCALCAVGEAVGAEYGVVSARECSAAEVGNHAPIAHIPPVLIRLFFGRIVAPPRLPRHAGPAHRLDRGDARERPQVSVRDPRVGRADRLEEGDGVDEACPGRRASEVREHRVKCGWWRGGQ